MSQFCVSCHAALKPYESACPYCGTAVSVAELSDEQIKQIRQFLESLNRNFHPNKNRATDHGLLVWIVGSLLAVGVLILLVVLGQLTVVWGGCLGVLLIFLLFWLGVGAGEFWLPESYNRRSYDKTIRPLIDAYITEKQLTPAQFLFAANQVLSKKEKMRRYLFEDFADELS